MSILLLTTLLTGALGSCAPGGRNRGVGAELLYNFKLTDQTGPGVYPSLRQKRRTLDKYTAMLEDLATLPVSFVYDGAEYRGLDTKAGGPFKEKSRRFTASGDGRKLSTTVELAFRDKLAVTLEAAVYPDYCAYE